MKDIDLENCTVYIRNSKNSRRKFDGYGKDRIIKFHPDFRGPIEKWKEIIEDSKWFLPSMTHPSNPLRKKSLHEQYRDLLIKAELLIPEYQYEITQKNRGKLITMKVNRHRYCFHTLRHTYAQLWRDNGGDRDTLQKQLGHSDPATTQKYYDTTEEQVSGDVNRVFGKDNPVMTSTIRELPTKIASNNSNLEIARLEYEKKKLELEILREQSKMNEVKQNEEQTKGCGGEGV
jgi:integrase